MLVINSLILILKIKNMIKSFLILVTVKHMVISFLILAGIAVIIFFVARIKSKDEDGV